MTDKQQPEALPALIERFRGLHFDHAPDGWPAVRTREITALLDRITELESQLAQRFDAADVATASAQGFRDGVASVSAVGEPEAWREHVEQRLLAWRQSFVNRSGDQLALDDFMDEQSLDDLIDFVCDESRCHPLDAPSSRPGPADGESNE